MNIYPFIEAEKACGRNVKRACELLKVSRAAFYQYLAGPPPRERADAELADQIRVVHAESKGRYGAPRVHAQLARDGHHHGRKRVARLMRGAGLRGRAAKRWKRTTIADPAAAARADKVRRDFTANAAAVNSRWCGDITYISTWEGWLYLATVIDIASRRVVGYAMADHLRAELVSGALANAVAARDRSPGVVFHSDRGCQYTSAAFAELAGDFNVELSHGRTGQCWDNALAESFFGSIKGELIDLKPWPTRTAARHAVTEYIGWYNGTAAAAFPGCRVRVPGFLLGPLRVAAGPVLGRQPVPRLSEPLPPFGPAGQRPRRRRRRVTAVPGVVGSISRGRLREQLVDLRQRPVRLLRGVAGQLGAIQAEGAQRHHALGGQQPQHLAEQPAQRHLMLRPEPGDGRVIGLQPAGDHPVAHVAHAPLLDDPAGPLSLAVAIQQQRDHHLGVERRPPVPVGPVPAAELAQIQGGDRVQYDERQIVLGQPFAHVHRQQQRLITLRINEVLRHKPLSRKPFLTRRRHAVYATG